MAKRKVKPVSKNGDGLAQFIGFLRELLPSADKDLKANIFIDGSIVLLYVIVYINIIQPMFGKLNLSVRGVPVSEIILLIIFLFAMYQIPFKAVRSCYNLFVKKLNKRGFELEELG